MSCEDLVQARPGVVNKPGNCGRMPGPVRTRDVNSLRPSPPSALYRYLPIAARSRPCLVRHQPEDKFYWILPSGFTIWLLTSPSFDGLRSNIFLHATFIRI